MSQANTFERGVVILRATFTARDDDVDVDLVGTGGLSRREAAKMLARLAASLAQAAAVEDEEEP